MEIKRYVILFFAFLLVAKVLSCRLVDDSVLSDVKRCPPVPAAAEISRAEIEAFLKLWSEYMAEGYNLEVSDKMSLQSGKPSETLPWKLKLWLSAACWDANRFYYVEERLRAILRTLYLREHAREVEAILTEKLEREEDEAVKQSYRDMIAMQAKIAAIEGVSEAELELVNGRAPLIEKVLNGETGYK